jgi:hypothetical protein
MRREILAIGGNPSIAGKSGKLEPTSGLGLTHLNRYRARFKLFGFDSPWLATKEI